MLYCNYSFVCSATDGTENDQIVPFAYQRDMAWMRHAINSNFQSLQFQAGRGRSAFSEAPVDACDGTLFRAEIDLYAKVRCVQGSLNVFGQRRSGECGFHSRLRIVGNQTGQPERDKRHRGSGQKDRGG